MRARPLPSSRPGADHQFRARREHRDRRVEERVLRLGGHELQHVEHATLPRCAGMPVRQVDDIERDVLQSRTRGRRAARCAIFGASLSTPR